MEQWRFISPMGRNSKQIGAGEPAMAGIEHSKDHPARIIPKQIHVVAAQPLTTPEVNIA
jgi:hypothetical protein